MLCATHAVPAAAAPKEDRPYLSRRVVRVFDFEERQRGNFERLPQYWFVLRGPGYPNYSGDLTRFDEAHRRSGEYSLKLELNGGSAGVILQRGTIAAVPGADYIVTASVRTEKLKHARARLSGYFVDQVGQAIEGSRAASQLVASNDKWSRLEMRLRGDFDNAAWIVMRLELIQPSEYQPKSLGKHELFKQDIGGAGWFDDLSVFQLPRVEINTQSPTNILRGEAPTLNLKVRDLTGEKLTVESKLYDHLGRLVDTNTRTLAGRQAPNWRWQPELPAYGWYWADLTVRSGQRMVGARSCAFAWLPRASSQGQLEAHRFGIVAERLAGPQRRMLPQIARLIGTGSMIIDVWSTESRDSQLQEIEHVDPVINELIKRNQRLTLSIAGVPMSLASAAKTDLDAPLALLNDNPDLWRPYMQIAAVQYGQNIARWQVGPVGSNEAFERDDLAHEYAQLIDWYTALVPDVRVALPWSADRALDRADTLDALTMRVPTAIQPDHLPLYALKWRKAGREVALVFDTLDPKRFNHQQRAEDLAMRIVRGWQTEPDAVFVRHPWQGDVLDEQIAVPDPLLAVYANLIERLGERRVVGRMHLEPGVECLILDGPSGGALVVWNKSSKLADPRLEMYLGKSPQAVDLWGNRSPLSESNGKHVMPIGRAPVFIEGIDAPLAQFRGAMRVEPSFVESRAKVQSLNLTLANPWPRTVTGHVRLTNLTNWKLRPRLIRFSIPAGGTFEVPLEVAIPVSEVAGPKKLEAKVYIEADRNHDIVATVPLEVGLRDIELNANLVLETQDDGTQTAVITVLLTNRGNDTLNFYAFAQAPGRPAQQRIISSLKPDQTVMKRFRFTDATKDLSAKRIRIGLREMDGPAVMNKILTVP